MFTGVWFVHFCALVRCGRAIHSDVVPLTPMWFDLVRRDPVLSDVVISHTAPNINKLHAPVALQELITATHRPLRPCSSAAGACNLLVFGVASAWWYIRGRCSQYGRCVVLILAGAWFIQTPKVKGWRQRERETRLKDGGSSWKDYLRRFKASFSLTPDWFAVICGDLQCLGLPPMGGLPPTVQSSGCRECPKHENNTKTCSSAGNL